jgi:hypothetical protein
MDSNEDNINTICRDSAFNKKYRIAALKLLQSTLVQYIKYRRDPDYPEDFKTYYIFKNWGTYTNLTRFKKIRKKYKIKFLAEQNEEDINASLHNYLSGCQETLDHMVTKVNNVAYRFYDPKRDTGKGYILMLSV